MLPGLHQQERRQGPLGIPLSDTRGGGGGRGVWVHAFATQHTSATNLNTEHNMEWILNMDTNTTARQVIVQMLMRHHITMNKTMILCPQLRRSCGSILVSFVKNCACWGFEISYMDSSWKNSWCTFLAHLSRRLTRWAYSIAMVRRPSSVLRRRRRRPHFQTCISLKPAGQPRSNFMCSITGVGERLHKVLGQIR